MKRLKRFVSALLIGSLILGSGNGFCYNVKAEEVNVQQRELVLAGTPYDESGTYDVSVPHVVINQVYGGSDASDASASHGFVELYNPTNTEINLSSWSLQYHGSEADSLNNGWEKLELTGKIPAKSSYLIRAKQSNEKADYMVPQGDQEWDIYIYNKGVSVVLLSSSETLEDKNLFDSEKNVPSIVGYVDMVGVNGNDANKKADQVVSFFEGEATNSQSKKKGIRRLNFQDTDNNAVGSGDFEVVEYGPADIGDKYPRSTQDGSWGVTDPDEGDTNPDSGNTQTAVTGVPYTDNDYNTLDNYNVATPHVLINQVYGGGNGKGAASHGFIELYNPTGDAVDLSQWSVQYHGSADDSKNLGWQKLNLTGTIPSHCSYLIRTDKYKITDKDTNTDVPHNYNVPEGDQTWDDLKINNKGVCVVLMCTQTALTDDTTALFDKDTKKPLVTGYVDMLGVSGNDGTEEQKAPYSEGYATASQSSKKAIRRIAFQDTDCNAADTFDGDFTVINYTIKDQGYINWAQPRKTTDGAWNASEMPEFTETTSLATDAINTITNTFGSNVETTRQFTWQMPVGVDTGYVEVSEMEDFSDAQKVSATVTLNHKQRANVFRATVTGLQAATTYYYKITSGGASSDTYAFTTGTLKDSFTFVHASDSQSKDDEGYDVFAKAVDAICEQYKPAFVLESGDLVDTNYFEDEWRWFIGKSQPMFATMAYIPVVGNHEQSATYDAWAFREHFSVPNACTDTNVTPGTVYSFDYGQAHFVVLNTECKDSGLTAQAAWLKNDLQASKQKYFIVSFHRGIYAAAGIGQDVKDAFLPVLDEFSVDLVLFGHDHSYIRTKSLKADQYDPNGTVYLQGGGCGSKQEDAQAVLQNYAEITGTPGMPIYNIVTVSDECITVKTVTVEAGQNIVSFEGHTSLKKAEPTSTVDFTLLPKEIRKDAPGVSDETVPSVPSNPPTGSEGGSTGGSTGGTTPPEDTVKPGDTTTPEVSTDPSVPAKGDKITASNGTAYVVTKAADGSSVPTVKYTAPAKASSTVVIPAMVKVDGVTYKVTSVAANAFKGDQKIKKVVIGKNVTTIGKNAFQGDKNLKIIVIKSTKLTAKSFTKNTLKGISADAVIKVPASKYKVYKKYIKASGCTAKIQKY